MEIFAKIQRSWRKNYPDLVGLLGHYPRFVTSPAGYEVVGELPVFCFHSVDQDHFEKQMRFLSENYYRTLSADEAWEYLQSDKKIPPRSIVLTFDDGRRCLWDVAHPVLKKYGLKAVCFIVAGLICNNRGRPENDPLVSWEEVLNMHKEGTVDFQSHTLWHDLISVGPEIVDFVHPGINLQFRNTELPVLRKGQKDDLKRSVELGMPVYKSKPRMSKHLRYFDDEELRQVLINHVKRNGGEDFFKKSSWRKELYSLFKIRKRIGLKDSSETPAQRQKWIKQELLESRKIIEERLQGKHVRHLCYPWFLGSETSVSISKDTGYVSNYWGVLRKRRTNKPGDDPFYTVRIPEDYLFRLPGKGRKTLLECFTDKIKLIKKGN